ncbi:MAG: hypothetical protein K0U38_10615 [Epsilonproteobacteria bacterium]|nr:hypothetical protein [Campylobacterota bacterium]
MTTLFTFLLVLMLVSITFFLLYLLYQSLTTKINGKKAAFSNQWECDKVLREQMITNYTDYFWTDAVRFVWVSIFFIFLIALGIAIGGLGLIFSFVMALIYVAFLIFAYQSYYAFPEKAKAKLAAFESAIKGGIEKEISFEGDNIQSFTDKDDEFDTKPVIFAFPVEITKFNFPPLEKNPAKKTVISTRKLEFLILSREYFSICKGATTFNLTNPKRGDIKKKCAEAKGSGECNEYYYSQMRNVLYDTKAKGIRIVYNHEQDDEIFKCKKDPKAMKAIKEKLRLTERQKLKKIEEHKNYEEIKDKRDKKAED